MQKQSMQEKYGDKKMHRSNTWGAENNTHKKYVKQLFCSTYTIDIFNLTHVMEGKYWVKSWGMYRWAGEVST